MSGYQLTAIIEREGNLFIARCVELDIAGQGPDGSAALSNLKEAVALFLDNAQETEILERLARDVAVAVFQVERR